MLYSGLYLGRKLIFHVILHRELIKLEILCTYFQRTSKTSFINRLSSLVWRIVAIYDATCSSLKVWFLKFSKLCSVVVMWHFRIVTNNIPRWYNFSWRRNLTSIAILEKPQVPRVETGGTLLTWLHSVDHLENFLLKDRENTGKIHYRMYKRLEQPLLDLRR